MTTPIELLEDRAKEIRKMRKITLSNNNFEDYEKIKDLEILYYASIEFLRARRKTVVGRLRAPKLSSFERQDIINNCVAGLPKDHVNSTTSFAKKYDLKIKTVSNILYNAKNSRSKKFAESN